MGNDGPTPKPDIQAQLEGDGRAAQDDLSFLHQWIEGAITAQQSTGKLNWRLRDVRFQLDALKQMIRRGE